MNEILAAAFNKLTPLIVKCVRGKSSPWLSAEIKAQMNVRDRVLRKSRKNRRIIFTEEYKPTQNQVNIMILSTKSDFTKTLLSENANNPNCVLVCN